MSTQHNPRNEADVTYTIVINEAQRRLLQQAVSELLTNSRDGMSISPLDEEGDDEVLDSLEDMLSPNGSVGPLLPSPAVNGLTL